ncbi:hypothetical protein LN458_11580, partial [Xanthomonas arboricola]|uniref:hypothetical protein n=1 Tax=Xanthomonas arboricola TaxID=56448 RepID=UPI001E52A103
AGKGPAAKSQTSRSAANAQINSIANCTHLADKPSVVSVKRVQTTCETAGVRVERHVTSLASHVPRVAAIQVLDSAASQPAVRQWAPVALSR